MTREEIFNTLKEVLITADDRNKEAVEACSEDSDLMKDFGFSSVNMLYLVIAIEETFDIRFTDVGVSDFKRVGDVITYIEGELKK